MQPSLLRTLAAAAALLCAPAIASAAIVTVGDTDPPTDVGVADGWDAIFIFTTAMMAPTATDTLGQVVEFEFWADAGTLGRSITPLLFASDDGGATHETIGVGTTYTIGLDATIDNGVNTLEFGLTGGTDTFDTVTAGTTYYVGFHTTDRGGNAADSGGVVPFAGTGGGPNLLWQTETVPSVGQDPSAGSSATFSSNRAYAYNFDIDYQPSVVDPDTDGDGMRDSFEQRIIDADPSDGIDSFADVLPGDDFDNDGSTNLEEAVRGTDPLDPDTDGDGLLDGYETNTGVYVSATDTGTSPLLADTDGDTLPDGAEDNSGNFISTASPGTDPNKFDTDGDGLADNVEDNGGVFSGPNMTGTDPNNPDTDDDLASDGAEVAAGTNPLDPNDGATNGLIAGQQMVATDQTVADSWAVCYIDEQRPFKLRGGTSNALDFNFFAAPASIGLGGRVTPFVAEVLAPNSFIVRAIGTTRLEGVDWTAAGLHSFPFSDDDSPVVEDGWVAGFITSDPDGSNPSNQIVPFRGNAGVEGWLTGSIGPADPGGIELGQPPTLGTGTNTEAYGLRDYSFQIVAGKPDRVVILDVSHDPAADTTALTWSSIEGELFEVRKSLDLTGDPNVWPLVLSATPASAAPATSTTIVVDSNATELAAFYKVFKIPPPPLFEDDFESGAPGWTTLDNGVGGSTRWELGSPASVGPIEAHSPSNCYGTDLDANYTDDLDNGGAGIALRSPLIDLRGATEATLTFWHYIDVAALDEGSLHFLDRAGALLATPLASPFFAFSGAWERVTIPLPPAVIANGETIVEWQLHAFSDGQPNFSGWYIDDVLIEN